jgi:predicted TPR repeat methyltransferase
VRHYERALDELANGRPAAAVAALKRALALDPKLAPAHHNLGMALEELGRLDEAEAAYRDALRVDPAYTAALNNLGELLQQRGRLEEARDYFQSALSTNPTRLVHMRLGTVLWKLGDSARALDAFERSIAGGSNSAESYYNLGSAQLELGKFDDAIHSAREALRLSPAFSEALTLYAAALAATGAVDAGIELLQKPEGHLLLAIRLLNSRLFGPARVCLEKAAQESSGKAMARHLLSALSGENPEHPVEGYVRELFDASAATFDQELVAKLGYGIPRELVDALRAVAGASDSRWNVLDLGCGTGLVGVEIARHSASLVGVDLSPNMINLAREREIYTELRCADLMAVLVDEAAGRARYDVVTAADVFIYVGKMDTAVKTIRQVLRPGGLFAFSAEATTTDGYRLGVMGRYAHSADYLRRLACENDFDIELLRATRIRFEHRRPVPGWLTVWRVPQGCSAAAG